MDDLIKNEENKPSTSKLKKLEVSNNESEKRRSTDELDLAEDGGFRGFVGF
jgi:hypothetical protein